MHPASQFSADDLQFSGQPGVPGTDEVHDRLMSGPSESGSTTLLSKRALAYASLMSEVRLEGDARRAQIVGIARQLFAEGGYRTTTTRQLARAAGVSDALMYRYFKSKDEVLRAVVDQGLAGFAAMREAAGAGRDRPLTERLTILGRAFLTTLDTQIDLLVFFVSEHQLLADDARLVSFIDLAATGLGAELAARAQAGEVRDDLDGYLFARSFMGSLVSFVLLQRALGMDRVHPVEAGNYLTGLVDLYVRGATP
jgi:AcrR family transcriptional regulator